MEKTWDGIKAELGVATGIPVEESEEYALELRRLADGRAIRAARMAAGLNQSELAALMGTSQSHVAKLESGVTTATLSTLERIADATGTQFEVRRGPMWNGGPPLASLRCVDASRRRSVKGREREAPSDVLSGRDRKGIMRKRDVLAEIAATTGWAPADVREVFDAGLSVITSALQEGDRVTLDGFGVFETHKRSARMGRNPRTGEAIPIAAKVVPRFRASRGLKEAVE